MAVFPNLPIFAQNGRHFVCYYGNGGLADKSSIYFLLSKTHSILLAEKIARFAKKIFFSYLPAVCGLKEQYKLDMRKYSFSQRVIN